MSTIATTNTEPTPTRRRRSTKRATAPRPVRQVARAAGLTLRKLATRWSTASRCPSGRSTRRCCAG